MVARGPGFAFTNPSIYRIGCFVGRGGAGRGPRKRGSSRPPGDSIFPDSTRLFREALKRGPSFIAASSLAPGSYRTGRLIRSRSFRPARTARQCVGLVFFLPDARCPLYSQTSTDLNVFIVGVDQRTEICTPRGRFFAACSGCPGKGRDCGNTSGLLRPVFIGPSGIQKAKVNSFEYKGFPSITNPV